MKPVDLLIKGGIVVTMSPELGNLKRGAVAVHDSRIVAVGPIHELETHFNATRVLDASWGLVMPGLINAHTHAPMTIFRGLADDLPLMEWLEGYIFPVEAHLSAEWVLWGARLACAEMLLGGTTTFCDMYLFEEQVAQAARESGMRAVVGEVLYDFPSPNYGPLEEGLRYTESLINKWRRDPLVSVAVEPHSPYTCAPELLARARQLANANGVPLIIHLSETRDEVERIRGQYGTTPVRHLDRLGILDGFTIATHVIWVEDEELEILKDRDVMVVHNPESNMKLASGVAPVSRMLEMGICVGLGTDGCASNNNLDLFSEMDTAAKLQKVQSHDPTSLSAPTVLQMATTMGARVLGLGDDVGSIETGKKADLIVLDAAQPHLCPLHNVESHLVYAAKASDVRTVVINGEIIVDDRALTTLSLERIFSAIEDISRKVSHIVQAARGGPPEGE